MADFISYGYAMFVTAGGVIGFLKAGSSVSLVMGMLFGALSGVGAYLVSQNPKNVALLLGTSSILALTMGLRFYKSGKFMPAGLVAVLSILMVTRLGLRILQ